MTYAELSQSLKARSFFGVTPDQWIIVSILIVREEVAFKQLYSLLWPDPDEEPPGAYQTCRSQISKARKAIKKFDLDIKTVWNGGCFMTRPHRARALELVKQAMEK